MSNHDEAKARESPPSTRGVPREIEELIYKLYPLASTRNSIRRGIREHLDFLQIVGDHEEIERFLSQELASMREEEKRQRKDNRRKLFTVVAQLGIAAIAAIAHYWPW